MPDLAVVEANGETAAAHCARPNSSAALDARVVVPGSSVPQRSASQVAEAMAVQAASIIATWQENEERLLFLTGGDIAMAVLAWQGARYITVEAEWSPGVALGYVDGDPLRRVMTKAGALANHNCWPVCTASFDRRRCTAVTTENPCLDSCAIAGDQLGLNLVV